MSLHEDIVEYIRSGETAGQTLGLEIEHFVVNDEEQMNMLYLGYSRL